jgi:hypothetical protein
MPRRGCPPHERPSISKKASIFAASIVVAFPRKEQYPGIKMVSGFKRRNRGEKQMMARCGRGKSGLQCALLLRMPHHVLSHVICGAPSIAHLYPLMGRVP